MRREAANRVTIDCWYQRQCGAVVSTLGGVVTSAERGCRVRGGPAPQSRLMQFQAMSIMAEIEGETDAGDDAEEKVLVAIKAYPNGSFDIRPSFTADGETHRFQTLSGAVYEYTVHNGTCREPDFSLLHQCALGKLSVAPDALKPVLDPAASRAPPRVPSPLWRRALGAPVMIFLRRCFRARPVPYKPGTQPRSSAGSDNLGLRPIQCKSLPRRWW